MIVKVTAFDPRCRLLVPDDVRSLRTSVGVDMERRLDDTRRADATHYEYAGQPACTNARVWLLPGSRIGAASHIRLYEQSITLADAVKAFMA